MVSSREIPTTSAFKLRDETACCLSESELNCIDARLDATGALEVELRGGITHFARELVNEFTAIAREKTLDPFDIMPVFLGGNSAAARTRPKAYVRIEARPRSRLRQKSLERPRVELALQAAPFVAFRRTNRHDFARDINQLARRAAIGVRAKISRTLYVLFTRVFNSGENIAFRNRDERIAFIVFKSALKKGENWLIRFFRARATHARYSPPRTRTSTPAQAS